MAPEVETAYGRVRGDQQAGIRRFRGVPFARPIRGEYRFRPPTPPDRWTGTFDATQPGEAAPQYALPYLRWINAAGGRIGEDCLSLNIWTPGCDNAKRPVLVWIHGGAFLVGSNATALYNGADLAQRGDLVVVSINYRLGVLGYAHLRYVLGEEFSESSNLGVRDQIAGLEWVRDHIDRFGGDPANVTVVGQSAGAMSVGALLGSARGRALFHRAVFQSGAGDHVVGPDLAEEVATNVLSELGGPPPARKALGRIPLDQVLRAQTATVRAMANVRRLMVFLPVVDGDVITESPLDAVRRGAVSHIPMLIGTTLDEWKLMRPVDGGIAMNEGQLRERFAEVLPDFAKAPETHRAVSEFRGALSSRAARSTPMDVWLAFQGARVMHLPATRLAEAQAQGGGTAYAYLFTWRPPAVRHALGACHSLDVPFVFGSIRHPLARPLTGFTTSASRLSVKMQSSWIGFARHGEPGHPRLPHWERYEARRRPTMILGRRCALDSAPLEPERRLLVGWSGGCDDVQQAPAPTGSSG